MYWFLGFQMKIFYWLYFITMLPLLRSCNLFNDYCDTMEDLDQCAPVSWDSHRCYFHEYTLIIQLCLPYYSSDSVGVVQEEECLRRRRRSLQGEVVHRDQRDMAGKVKLSSYDQLYNSNTFYICMWLQVTRTLDLLFNSGYSKEFRPGVGGPPTQVQGSSWFIIVIAYNHDWLGIR